MAPYKYVKALSVPTSSQSLVFGTIPAYIFILIGLFLIANGVVPIISFELFTSRSLSKSSLQTDSQPQQHRPNLEVFTDSNSWFPSSEKVEELIQNPSGSTSYTISIPKLKIDKAHVEINSEDLKTTLVHYKGSTLPGQIGNAVVLGHS